MFNMAESKIYFDELLGLRVDCDIPYCDKHAESSGWAVPSDDPTWWYIEYICPDDGEMLVHSLETEKLLNSLLISKKPTTEP